MEKSNYKESHELSKHAYLVLRYLISNGKKTQKSLIEELNLPIRTVRYAIRMLTERELIRRVPNFVDMRSVYYTLSPEFKDIEYSLLQEMIKEGTV